MNEGLKIEIICKQICDLEIMRSGNELDNVNLVLKAVSLGAVNENMLNAMIVRRSQLLEIIEVQKKSNAEIKSFISDLLNQKG